MNSVFAKTLYTGRKVIKNAYLHFNGKKISAISTEMKGELLGRFSVISPAVIDPHSHIGMVRSGEPSGEAEGNEHLDSILPLTDALDSIYMDDQAFKQAIEMGALYSCVVPGSGNIIGGLSAVIKNYGNNTTDALVARAGVKAAFGYNPRSTVSWKGSRPTTRMGAAALLRAKLDMVSQKIDKYKKASTAKKKNIIFTAEEAVLRDVLNKKHKLRTHVHKIDDIASLIRIADEFKISVTVEHAGDVFEPGIYKELKKRKIPVIYGPSDCFAYKVELKHENWRNIKHLVDSGVQYGLMTDHPVTMSGMLFLQTRWFMRCGLSKQDAIELITRKNAEIIGIDKILGTLEKGKWASFVCWNGDPFDISNYPVMVFGEGSLLFED